MDDDKAIEYVAEKFRGLGVFVEESGIEAVLDYYDEYYDNHESDIILTTREEVVSYICETTDIPLTAIRAVLDAEQECYESMIAGGRDETT